MNKTNQREQVASVSRRDVVKAAAAALAGTFAPAVHAAASDKLRVGLIGCGRRGGGAIGDCLSSSPNLELTAIGDVLKERTDAGFNDFSKRFGEKCKLTLDTCFSGWDAYQKVLQADVDVVLLCAPPGFRPLMLKAAVEAGKHVFMEKPVAVDPAGVRSIVASAEEAKKKNLAVVAGTQRRHQPNYVDIMKRIHDGQIGQITAAQGYWLGDYSYYNPVAKKPEWSDMEWQLRNWNYFAWLSGDIIVEQHVHNLDVLRWALRGNPVKCIATGSRAVRTDPVFGHIYDNFSVSYEFAGGVNVLSMCRQMSKCSGRVSETIIGAKASVYTDGSGNGRIYAGDQTIYKFEGEAKNPYVQEHTDMIASIRAGQPLNEGKEVAYSTLMAVMGRMSAYTGREVSWDWVLKSSKLDLTPPQYGFGPLPVAPVAVPGETPLI
jgi:predicted dehydrogenase